ncbi:putative deacetylvindoline O-acetyltransferase-like [Capsicum annuum]|nr:putative deacetylvindoline O-acetyltransferase-like [Capsicum annuum]
MRPSKLVNFFNIRTMMKPRLPPSAIGNVLSAFSTQAINTMLVRNLRKLRELKWLAYTKDQVEQNEQILEAVNSMKKGKMLFENKDENCTMYSCSDLCKFPYYSVDFGWGKPERVSLANGPSKKIIKLGEAWRRG